MSDTFDDRLARIPWAEMEADHWPPQAGPHGLRLRPYAWVPDALRRLAETDTEPAFLASHDLRCGLCHPHVSVDAAALPALPFLLEVLDRAGYDLALEILDILFDFAKFTHPESGGSGDNRPDWVRQLRAELVADRPRLEGLAMRSTEDVATFTRDIFRFLDPHWPPNPEPG